MVTWQWQKGNYYGVCRRKSEACKSFKLLREDCVEDMIVKMFEKLVCPSQDVIEWVADTMRDQYRDSIENQERLKASIKTRLQRIQRMDNSLYDDKLSGDISQERYTENMNSS